MATKTITAECHSCESSYEVFYMEELTSQPLPEHCPFCGEVIEELTEEFDEDLEDDENDDRWD